MRTRTLWLACAALLLPAVGGCGGGDNGGDRLSKSEFLAKGNAICTETNREFAAVTKKAFGEKEPTPAQITRFATGSSIPIAERTQAQLRALKPPKDDEDAVNAILEADQAAINELKTDPSVLVKTDPFRRGQQLALRYGLKACGPED
jgi:hypothetical protein